MLRKQALFKTLVSYPKPLSFRQGLGLEGFIIETQISNIPLTAFINS